jgi:hypothetical protein
MATRILVSSFMQLVHVSRQKEMKKTKWGREGQGRGVSFLESLCCVSSLFLSIIPCIMDHFCGCHACRRGNTPFNLVENSTKDIRPWHHIISNEKTAN